MSVTPYMCRASEEYHFPPTINVSSVSHITAMERIKVYSLGGESQPSPVQPEMICMMRVFISRLDAQCTANKLQRQENEIIIS